MRRHARIAGWIALVVYATAMLGLAVYGGTTRSSSAETSCTQIIHHYLHSTASAAGVTLTHEHLIACRHTDSEATVRVEFDVDIPGQPRQHEILSVRLVKSAWWASDTHLVG